MFEPGDFERLAVLDLEEATLYLFGRLSKAQIAKLGEFSGRFVNLTMEADQDERIVSLIGAQSVKKILVFTRPAGLVISSEQFPQARLIGRGDINRAQLPVAFREELLGALERSPVSAVYAGSEPVAFCYAASQSPRFWDVSVDTLPAHRRQGFAKQCALHMINFMEARGKQVVWQAFADNPPSWKLAQSIGLVETCQLLFVEKGN